MIIKKLRLLALIVKAFWIKEKKLILLSTFLGVSFFFLITKIFPYIPRPKKTDKIGVVGNFTFENLPLPILYQVSSGLTKVASDGTPIPSLAEKWRIENDGKKYTFWLAENIFWQDGTPVVSEDVNFDLTGVTTKVINNKIISFELPEPFTPFPILLSTPIFKKNYLGTGKYEIKNLKKNGNFVKKIFLAGPDKNILYNFYPTQEIALRAFKIGEIDSLQSLTANPFDDSWKNNIIVETKINKDQYLGVFFNLRDKNLSNKNLRQALAYATPKPDDQTRAIGPIQESSWAFNPDVKPYLADAVQAKKLFDKFKEEAKVDKLKLRLDTTNELLESAQAIAKAWQEILGVETEIGLIDRISKDFNILLIVSQIPQDPDQYSFWHSTQETNLTGYKSPKVDKILEDARRMEDKKERREKYLDFQRFLLEDCPVIFISHPRIFDIKRKKIFG